jgi:hypothetical protein
MKSMIYIATIKYNISTGLLRKKWILWSTLHQTGFEECWKLHGQELGLVVVSVLESMNCFELIVC